MKQKKVYVCSFVKLCTDLDARTIGFKLLCRKCFITDNEELVHDAVKKLQEDNTEFLTCEIVVYHKKVEDVTYIVKNLQSEIEKADKELKQYLGKHLRALIEKTLDRMFSNGNYGKL